MVATTHSPQLLKLLSPQTLESASLTYRLEDKPDAKIIRILASQTGIPTLYRFD
jgi:hypothetical protein